MLLLILCALSAPSAVGATTLRGGNPDSTKEMHSAIDDERSAQAAFESTMTALTKQEKELIDGINTYKQALADTETSIEEAHENLASTERDHAAIVAYLAAIEPDCTFYITNYETRKQ